MVKFEILPIKHRILSLLFCAAATFLIHLCLGAVLLKLDGLPNAFLVPAAALVCTVFGFIGVIAGSVPKAYFRQYQIRRFTSREAAVSYDIPAGAGILVGAALALFTLTHTIWAV